LAFLFSPNPGALTAHIYSQGPIISSKSCLHKLHWVKDNNLRLVKEINTRPNKMKRISSIYSANCQPDYTSNEIGRNYKNNAYYL
jgi:hypothetical protein